MRLMCASLGLLCLFVVGCSSGPEEPKDRPARTKVSGVVTQKGTPVEGATVTLHPTQQGGQGAVGITDAKGRYVLGTFDKDDGVIPGEYLVSITKLEVVATSQPTPDDPNYDPNAKEEPPKHLLPPQYADANKSGLKASVTTNDNDSLNFDLE